MNTISNLLTTGGMVVGCVAAGGVMAQTAAPADLSKAADNGMTEVVITAERTAGVPSKTPIALSVVSGEMLKEQGVFNAGDLQNIVPAVNIGNQSHGVNISIRGVSTTDLTSKGEQGVSFNLDGVPISRPQIMGNAFFDLERVEVLRGPQGTLYGKSSTGGAINVVTAKPQKEFDAAVSVELGSFNARRSEMMLNVPVSDNLALRAAASVNSRDGYLTESINKTSSLVAPKLDDENNRTARLSALWDISKSASLLVTGTFGHIGGSGPGGALYDSVLNKDGKAARQVYFNPYTPAIDDNFTAFNTEFNLNLGAVHLTYVGGHSKFKAHDIMEPSVMGTATLNGNNYTWIDYRADITNDAHEIRLANAAPQQLEWVAGINYQKELNNEKDNNWISDAQCAPSLSAACNLPNPGIVGPTQHSGKSVFGQVNFHATEALKYTAGLRYSSDSMFRKATIAAGPGPFLDASGAPCAPPNSCVSPSTNDDGSQSAKRLTWRLGADYTLAPRHMVYGYVASGYKGGGFNDLDPATGKPGPYDPEKVIAYEAGYKAQLTPALQYNTSLYYYDYQSFQVTSATFFGFGPGGPVILIYTKGAEAKMKGWENELNWKATPYDKFGLTLAFERARYGDLGVGFIAAHPVDFSGKTMDNAPTVSGAVSYEHRWELASGNLSLRWNTRFNSGYYKSDLAGAGLPVYARLPAQYKQPGFTRSDLSLSYVPASGKFDLHAYVRNIEDKLQLNSLQLGTNSPGVDNAATARVTAPRTFGLRLAMHY
ncbi:TonB-dependent receptor [Duganella sp. PWIR1]